MPSSQEEGPLRVGSFHLVNWRGKKQKAKIIDCRLHAGAYEYYVHYIGFDRRLDEWVHSERVDEVELLYQEESASLEELVALPQDDEEEQTGIEDRTITRGMKRKRGISEKLTREVDRAFLEAEKEREEITKVRNIGSLYFGQYVMTPWYYSPYPFDEEKEINELYVCEYCLKYIRLAKCITWHRSHCKRRKPPGRVVYRQGKLKIYEVDGKEDKLYCQNLCLMTKLFLDHKTVYFDMDPFIFYILTESDDSNTEIDRIVGYFSKEKQSFESFNLACILILPPHQRKGYGRMLIEFSYELSKVEGKIGSPERPISDLGMLSYRSYWQSVLIDILQRNVATHVSFKDISLLTSIHEEDIIYTLNTMNMLRFWKGEDTICVTSSMVEEFLSKTNVKIVRLIDVSQMTIGKLAM